MKKAAILFSGGLDSRVTAKFMEELGFEVHLIHVKLAFGAGCGSPLTEIENFSKEQNFPLHIIDATKDNLLKEYVDFIKNPKHGTGTAVNPCKDCKIFIFKESDKVAKEIGADIICTGEVMDQRPMSQKKNALVLDEEQAGMKGRLLRPLSAKHMPETIYEKEGIIDREKLLDIHGRQRQRQMEMADKYKITYPGPGGGCLLCEKLYGKKLKIFLENIPNPNFDEILLLRCGRMFKDKGLIFVGRHEKDNTRLQELSKKLGWNLIFNEDVPGPTVAFQNKEDKELSQNLWEAYRGKDLDERAKFEKHKI